MADRKRLTDPTQTHFLIECPACGQKYALYGLMVQDEEEMACAQCNALFRLNINGDKVGVELVVPPTGFKFGPAEGPRDKRR